jgi:hypothetical protein
MIQVSAFALMNFSNIDKVFKNDFKIGKDGIITHLRKENTALTFDRILNTIEMDLCQLLSLIQSSLKWMLSGRESIECRCQMDGDASRVNGFSISRETVYFELDCLPVDLIKYLDSIALRAKCCITSKLLK